MPLFDYDCRACGRSFEAIERRGGAPVACPDCGSTGLDKRISSPPRQVKHRLLKGQAIPIPGPKPIPGTKRIK